MRWKLAEWNEERDDSPATFRELNSAGRKSLRSVNNTVINNLNEIIIEYFL